MPISGGVRTGRRSRKAGGEVGAPVDEQRLATSVAAGDVDALRAIHARYGPVVFGLLRRTLRDEMTAEDVFQQVMTEVWQRASSFDATRGSLTTWMLTLARSRAIDEMRRRQPTPVDPATIAATSATTDADFEQAVAEWELADLLQRLPSDEREVLALRMVADLSQSQIAERTGLPVGTVKTRMTRGLGRLREMMGAAEPSSGGGE